MCFKFPNYLNIKTSYKKVISMLKSATGHFTNILITIIEVIKIKILITIYFFPDGLFSSVSNKTCRIAYIAAAVQT